jgi:hypothetical protein
MDWVRVLARTPENEAGAAVKACTKCLKIKPEKEFWRQRATSDGLQSWCKDCVREIQRLRSRAETLMRRAEREAAKRYRVCARCHVEKLLDPQYFIRLQGFPEVFAEVCVDCTVEEGRLISAPDGADDVAETGNTSEGEDMAGKTKICTRCKKRRKVDAFYKDRSKRDGLDTWCKECQREHDRMAKERKKAEASK